ncbi:ankyrin repeat [Anaeramoeba flamelloides]|uniref:Ankyrin repeat n=1 Tax=Anaeramoeba flamelloides TaxID=1746091 RepID=A0ABQ8YCX7_9EUKA|nr:ankyrin repeat [Anaeramoeba flamelloides]
MTEELTNLSLLEKDSLKILKSGNLKKIRRTFDKNNVHHYQAISNKETNHQLEFWSPLHFISYFNPKPEIVKLFCSLGASVNLRPETPIHFLSQQQNQIETIKLLYEKGADLNARTATPLHKCCEMQRNPEIIKYLIEKGADVNARMFTPLHIVCLKKDNIDIIKLLLKSGANTKLVNNLTMDTPLHLFCTYGANLVGIKMLLKYGADINAINKLQWTPFHNICQYEPKINFIKLFLSNGADPNAQDFHGNTPLHLFFTKYLKKIDIPLFSYYLLNNGTDFKIQNKDKKSVDIYFDNNPNEELKNSTFDIIHKFQSSTNDFFLLFKNSEFTDCEISGIKFHKFFVELRLGKQLEDIEKILKKLLPDDLTLLMNWIYAEQIDNLETLTDIFNSLEINDFQSKTIRKDLQELWNNRKETSDFKIISGDKKIPLHKFILMAKCKTLKGMFLSSEDDTKQITDRTICQIASLEIFFRFCYTNDFNLKKVTEVNQIELELLEDFYQLNKNSIFRFIIHNFTTIKKKWI